MPDWILYKKIHDTKMDNIPNLTETLQKLSDELCIGANIEIHLEYKDIFHFKYRGLHVEAKSAIKLEEKLFKIYVWTCISNLKCPACGSKLNPENKLECDKCNWFITLEA